MIRSLETVALGGTSKIQLWPCFILMVIMMYMSGVLIYATRITKYCVRFLWHFHAKRIL